jgi:hypothetical protein
MSGGFANQVTIGMKAAVTAVMGLIVRHRKKTFFNV